MGACYDFPTNVTAFSLLMHAGSTTDSSSPQRPSQCYDGQSDLFSASPLNLGVANPRDGALLQVSCLDDASGQVRGFDVVVRLVADVDVLGSIRSFIQAGALVTAQRSQDPPGGALLKDGPCGPAAAGGEPPQAAVRVLESLMRHARFYDPRWINVGRSFVDTRTVGPLGQGLTMMTGFTQGIAVTQTGVHLVSDRTALAFVEPGPLLTVLQNMTGVNFDQQFARGGGRPLDRNAPEWRRVKKAIKGLRARTAPPLALLLRASAAAAAHRLD